MLDLGFNPSIVVLPQKYAVLFNATYVATSRYEANNINKCKNSLIKQSYKHTYSSTLVSLLDKNYDIIAHTYMEGGDNDGCESGRWRGVDSRLLINHREILVSYVNFWGSQPCRGYWLSKLTLISSNGIFRAFVNKKKKLIAPRNSGVNIIQNEIVEFDVNGTHLNLYGEKKNKTLVKIPKTLGLHTSGHPFILNSTHIALWTHYHKYNGGAFRYGHEYRHTLIFLTHSYDFIGISSPFCLYEPCKPIEFVMNTFRDINMKLNVAVGIDDCYGMIKNFNISNSIKYGKSFSQ